MKLSPSIPPFAREAVDLMRDTASRVLTAVNKAAKGYGVRSYDMAKVNSRTQDWVPPMTSGNQEIREAGDLIRSRSYDLVRSAAIAARIRQAVITRVVGRGITPQCDDPEWMAAWNEWQGDCYTGDRMNWAGVQTTLVGSMFDGGGAFARRRGRKADDVGLSGRPLSVPLQLQLYEYDQIDHTKDFPTPSGGKIIQGIEYDAIGRPIQVHFFQCHPSDFWYSTESFVSTPVPFSDLAHLYRDDRPGDSRGTPWLRPVARRLRDLDKYADYELTRKRQESCTVAVVIGGDDNTDMDDEENRITPSIRNMRGQIESKMNPGQYLYTEGGRDIKFHSPSGSQGYDAYIKAVLHEIAAGMSLPYYSISSDLSQCSYSSARIGDVEARAWVRPLQEQVLIPKLCDPVARWFTDAAYACGRLPRRDYAIRWILPAIEEHNRDEAAKADREEIRCGLTSLPDVQLRRGYEPAALLKRIADSNKALDDAGVVLDSDPRNTTTSGSAQASSDANTPPADPNNPDQNPIAQAA